MTKMITTNSPMIPMRNPPFHSSLFGRGHTVGAQSLVLNLRTGDIAAARH
jgi:hypothetical protein